MYTAVHMYDSQTTLCIEPDQLFEKGGYFQLCSSSTWAEPIICDSTDCMYSSQGCNHLYHVIQLAALILWHMISILTVMNGRSTYKKVIDIGRDRGRETEKIVTCDKLLDFSLLDTWYDFDLTWHFKYLQRTRITRRQWVKLFSQEILTVGTRVDWWAAGRGLQQLKVSYS